jgi:UDP-N-acetylglucosamine diphosphorylase / glucose-1-phosphate thymidylyltransferase / UDP-N-acetylgalactosamine diphosphorylase / glucosamine-1-phosphate N-acetyltransferase / galactosamine-1-phosphate N-acetyltransferase
LSGSVGVSKFYMQCVILAAGKGTRMRPLTLTLPKPLVLVCNKPLLQHIVEALPSEIDEIILVVGYLEEQIRAYCGSEFCGRRVQYVTQENPAGGTGDALKAAAPLLHGRFLFMYADDIHGATALKTVVSYPYAMLAARSKTPEQFGVLALNSDGTLKAIIEKPKFPPSNLINIGGIVLDMSVFTYDVSVSNLGELLVTDMVTAFAEDNQVAVVEQSLWIPVGKPEDIAAAEATLCPKGN